MIENIETKWQKKWKDNKVFQPVIDKNKEKFVMTVAYPYANSVLHIGHGRTFTMADIISRFERLNGKNVLYPMGFHISGTPVLAVADNIARGDLKQLKQTREAISEYITDVEKQDELLDKFKNPYEIAKFFSSTIESTFDSVGLSIDWSRQFSTGDEIYKKFVTWQFDKLYKKNILVQGKYPILYSPLDKNAVGEDDIKDGDLDKVSIQEMTMIYFKLENEDKYLAITTLRPDAIFGTTNMWINPNLDLVEVKLKDKNIIVVKEAFEKLDNQFDDVKLIGDVDVGDLFNKFVITPITNRKVPIIRADFLDKDHGTGVVYSSPAGSPHDFIALMEAKKKYSNLDNIKVLNTVDNFDKNKNKIKYKSSCPAEDKILKFKINSSLNSEKLELAKHELYKEEHYGGFLNSNAGEFSGLSIKNAKDKIKAKLLELSVCDEFLETSRRAVTRSGNKVIVAKLDGQWFLNYKSAEVKQKAYDLLDYMSYKPEKLRATQKGYLSWVEMRPCARKRGIGTSLSFDKNWVIEPLSDSTIYQMLYFIENILVENKISAEQLTLEVFDFIYLGIGDVKLISKNSLINVDVLNDLQSQVSYWKNVDVRYTNVGHMSNHLSFLIYHYALIFPKKNWPKNITVGGYLIKDGYKISKSKGNGIALMKMKQIYGVDLYRLYVGLAANFDIEMDFKDDDIKQLDKKYNKLKSLFEDAVNVKLKSYDSFSQIQKWLVSKFYSRVNDYFNFMNDTRVREAYVGILYEFLNDVIYHQRRSNEEDTLDVIRFILEDYLILMTPVIPHFTEEINEKLGNEDFISLRSFNKNYQKYINKDIEDIEVIISEIIVNISRQKEQKNLHKINTIKIIQSSDIRFKLFDRLSELLNEKLVPKEIIKTLNNEFTNEGNFIKRFVPKTFGSGLDNYLSKKDEFKLIESSINFLEEEFDCKNIIIENDSSLNSVNLIPGRPLVQLE